MTKGASQIESDFYLKLKPSLKKIIKGEVYRNGMRPINSKKEDAVVTYKSGLYGQFQDGEIMLNIYVPDRSYNKEYVKDYDRCMEIENKAIEIVSKLTDGEYLISLIETPITIQEEAISQHYVNIRLKYKRVNYK